MNLIDTNSGVNISNLLTPTLGVNSDFKFFQNYIHMFSFFEEINLFSVQLAIKATNEIPSSLLDV